MINYAAANMNQNPEIYPIESLYTHLSKNNTYYTNDKVDGAIADVLNSYYNFYIVLNWKKRIK